MTITLLYTIIHHYLAASFEVELKKWYGTELRLLWNRTTSNSRVIFSPTTLAEIMKKDEAEQE